ncbi:hypothetical protein DN756_02915 [Yersinia pseudotuberculosis]|nr:hypothetical protein EGX87_05280 [Yersinia pseudotuberculosis]AYX01305.1 hypothetical protein EGX53_16480 [Yersinia pseudotuberculosis]AZA29061.1 hypothetical protein DN756_02915 [Yersinia pseudotuberculosis]
MITQWNIYGTLDVKITLLEGRVVRTLSVLWGVPWLLAQNYVTSSSRMAQEPGLMCTDLRFTVIVVSFNDLVPTQAIE